MPVMNSLESRLDVLEGQNRRYRRALILAILAFGAFFAMGADTGRQNKVQARVFEVLDDKGNVLARVGSLNGSGTVTTFSSSGQILSDIVPTKNGSGGMVLYNGSGRQNLVFTDVGKGGGSLRVNNSKGAPGVILSRNQDDDGSIQVNSAGGSSVLQATADTTGSGAIIAGDANGKQVGRFPSGTQ
jgi:hypothetical protein